ncbi:MAG: UDP-N-acetylmuramoyl-L-alanyl-D-glutamate--2,6-diaminopimelate ligase, partial [Dechloromonas sp.]|nr:UDP-N-acetylmuramoyl-L-alanyl-D-glutamate--2,6-diaminopimelate ligase [Dechloromonas sp.]
AENLVDTPFGQRFNLVLPNGRAMVDTALVGRYNVSNLLAIAGVLFDAGLSAEDVALRLSEITAPPGRMERVGGNGEPLVAVDYAHTPDALDNALTALRDVATARGGRLSVVFGCGGDRDKGKRPQMGAVAERLADRVLITSDNPRSEAPQSILDDIAAGMTQAIMEIDRAAAIRQAILEADARDVVLLAGKGHEPYQDMGGVRLPFSDVEQAESALALRRRNQEDAA